MDALKLNLDEIQKVAKERTVKTQNVEYDLDTLKKRIDNGVIKLDPEYQRKHRWSDEVSSRLIESLILNIPIPTIYLSLDIDVDDEADETPRYSVIDGQQRLTAIYKFMSDDLELTGLELLKNLNGCKYKDLPPFLVRRLDDRTIKCLRIDSTLDGQVKYDIFERLNSGSVQLNSQELRNAIYRGPFNDMIKKLADNKNYRKMLHIKSNCDDIKESNQIDPKIKKMEDVEYILRFFSFDDYGYKNLTKLKDFLSINMKKFNKLSKEKLNSMENNFIKVIDLIYENFGQDAFAKYSLKDGKLEITTSFNTSVYDALMVAVSINLRENVIKINERNINKYKKLFEINEFQESITGGTVDRKKVAKRIELVREVLR